MTIRPFHDNLSLSCAAAATFFDQTKATPITFATHDITEVSTGVCEGLLRDQKGFLQAAKNGRIDLLKTALTVRSLPIVIINDALVAAASHGQLATVTFLVTRPQIKQSSLRSAFMIAIDIGYGAMAKVILPYIKARFYRIEDCIVLASKKGRRDLVKDLFERGMISKIARNAAFRVVTDSSISDILMTACVIPLYKRVRTAETKLFRIKRGTAPKVTLLSLQGKEATIPSFTTKLSS